mmetsp:Transcript_8296/g.14218  ORF Transcript_8296/g.14218 Transcript_8296/m.14218 type:complete len:369 (-) Transcript_8296:771-1877(-)
MAFVPPVHVHVFPLGNASHVWQSVHGCSLLDQGSRTLPLKDVTELSPNATKASFHVALRPSFSKASSGPLSRQSKTNVCDSYVFAQPECSLHVPDQQRPTWSISTQTPRLANTLDEKGQDWETDFEGSSIWGLLSSDASGLEQIYRRILEAAIQPMNTTGLPGYESSPSLYGGGGNRDPQFRANVGDVVETLRRELPRFFCEGLSYDIYTDDIVFRDGHNYIRGMRMYKALMWSIRFHARVLFSDLSLDVKRIHQPADDQITVRWTIRGTPRMSPNQPFYFDGCSVYRLNNKGFVYEHEIDNIIKINMNAYLEPLQQLWVLPDTALVGLTPAQFSLLFFEDVVLPSVLLANTQNPIRHFRGSPKPEPA